MVTKPWYVKKPFVRQKNRSPDRKTARLLWSVAGQEDLLPVPILASGSCTAVTRFSRREAAQRPQEGSAGAGRRRPRRRDPTR
jgi:hypothetical protein